MGGATDTSLTGALVRAGHSGAEAVEVAAAVAALAGGTATWGSVIGTLTAQADLNTALNAKQATLVSGTNLKTINGASLLGASDIVVSGASATITSASAAITVVAATHNNNVLATTSAAAVALTLNTGIALTAGMVVEQRGAGIVTLGGSATFIAPNGLSTSGLNTTMSIVPTEAADTYLVLVDKTSDKTFTNATAGATPAIDMAKYNVVDLTLTANAVPVFSGAVSGQNFSVLLIIRTGAGSFTWTGPTTKWAGGTPFVVSSAASKIDRVLYSTVDGGATYFGEVIGQAYA